MNDNEIDKKLVKSIKRQLEFYFSEGNLPRDEFMQKCIKSSKHQSISIDDLLKFNKLIEMNATSDLIILAVKKSKLLKFDENNTGIKRKIELQDLKPIDTRTIFVCGFLNNENQNSPSDDISKELKKKFKEFGPILRVDLPKYGSSNSLRGFAFLEFLTKTATRNALNQYKLSDIEERKANSWKYFSFSNNQYNHALKQLQLLGHPQKPFFEKFIGEKRRDKVSMTISCIAKKEWLVFRTQFYEAQQRHLADMRVLISRYGSVNASTCSHKQHERDLATISPPPVSESIAAPDDIISQSIVTFQCGENQTKKTIKEILSQAGHLANVAYVDFRDFSLGGHLRFSSADGAAAFIAANTGLESVHLLSAAEETQYLEKIANDKQTKRDSQKRRINRKRKLAQIDQ